MCSAATQAGEQKLALAYGRKLFYIALESRMKLFSQLRPRLCRLRTVLVLTGFVTCLACQHDKTSRVRIELHDLPSDKAAASKPVQPPPICPPAGIASSQPGAPGTGHHKVILSWNGSAPSNDTNTAAVGYCLYRSRSQYQQELKQDPLCKDCEQINRIPVPVPTTKCIDDVVADNAKYYYVVTAINANSILSKPSNDIFVPIPSASSVKPSPPSDLPLCRAGLQPARH